jgi:hypothetical protein
MRARPVTPKSDSRPHAVSQTALVPTADSIRDFRQAERGQASRRFWMAWTDSLPNRWPFTPGSAARASFSLELIGTRRVVSFPRTRFFSRMVMMPASKSTSCRSQHLGTPRSSVGSEAEERGHGCWAFSSARSVRWLADKALPTAGRRRRLRPAAARSAEAAIRELAGRQAASLRLAAELNILESKREAPNGDRTQSSAQHSASNVTPMRRRRCCQNVTK